MRKKNEKKTESFAHCRGKTTSLFAFQAPKAGNKQQFLERDMLNTLPVGYGCAKRLCEIPHSVLEDTKNDFLTICKLDMSLLSQSEMKCHHIKEQSAGFGINSERLHTQAAASLETVVEAQVGHFSGVMGCGTAVRLLVWELVMAGQRPVRLGSLAELGAIQGMKNKRTGYSDAKPYKRNVH